MARSEQEVPENFVIKRSSEKADKWFIQHKVPEKGYLRRDGSLGRLGNAQLDYANYFGSEEGATDFALAIERCSMRTVCPKCGRPFAILEDFQKAQLYGLCPTRYAPRDPMAADDCEKNKLAAPLQIPNPVDLHELGTALHHLFTYVQAMIRERVKHRNKGFDLSVMTWADMSRHLIEESEEARLAEDRDSKCMELADAFGVLIHMCCDQGMSHADLIALTLHKLALRFEIPKSVSRPIVAVDMGKPGGDHSVHYSIDTETLEIKEVKRDASTQPAV